MGDSPEESPQYSINADPYPEISDDDSPLIYGAPQPTADGRFPKARHLLGLMGFLGFANVYAMRVNLSVAIVAMVNHTAIPDQDNSTLDDVCPARGNSTDDGPVLNGEFDWDESTQGIVLGAFFYGYVLTQIPGGRMAETVGGKMIYGVGVLITAIFTFLTPIAAYWSLPALVIVRVIEGMGEGVTYPAMHAMLAKWIPPLERSKFAAVVYAGSNFGTIISLPLSGWLCSLDFLDGWPLAFYLFGALGVIWFIFWMYLVYNSPAQHPRIEPEERQYIQRSLARRDDELLDSAGDNSVPWRHIFTCLPMWAILVTQCGQAWAFYTLLTELPTYMDNILHFGINANATLSSLQYLTAWIFGILSSTVADWILAKGWLSQKNSYKFWNSVASIVPSIGLVGVAWVGCDWKLAMLMLAGFGAFQGAVYPGNQMNHIALSPRYAGTMLGITNGAGNMCGFLAPYIIGSIIRGHETLSTWRSIFYLAAVINVAGNFFYLLFASAEEQPWSKQRPQVR
ncbi:sialin [Phlebotomus argentipes]|uniref:sialin n=1 Tax=Phlebotomus argentipes TaxID=94469 RepID=UPI002893152F|nr:sialin [Phlebotomus argentipes]